MFEAKSEPSITVCTSFGIYALVIKSKKKSCSWFIYIQRLAIDEVLIMLVKTTIPVIVITAEVEVLLRTLAVSDAFEILHTPDERT